jgi:hypothetical protein
MVLVPGEEVTIPDKEIGTKQCTTGETHVFQPEKPNPCYFSVYLKDESGQPFQGYKSELTINDETFEGQTLQDGLVSHVVPPDAKDGVLEL